MSTPFLSIITINYNNAAGLRKTLESVKNQTSKNYEQIVIDGGSADGSVEVLEEFLSDKEFSGQVAYWCSECDRGVYDAMNKAIPHAQGEYCLFLNSGDYFADDDVVSRFSGYGLTDDVVYTNAICFDSRKEWKMTYPGKITAAHFFNNGALNHQNVLIKTSLQKAHLYSTDFKILSDREFFLYWLMNGGASFRFIDDAIAKYECETGISTTQIDLIEVEMKRLNDLYFSPQIQDSFAYVWNLYAEVKTELSVYTKCYHGILRRLKDALRGYSRIKRKITGGGYSLALAANPIAGRRIREVAA